MRKYTKQTIPYFQLLQHISAGYIVVVTKYGGVLESRRLSLYKDEAISSLIRRVNLKGGRRRVVSPSRGP